MERRQSMIRTLHFESVHFKDRPFWRPSTLNINHFGPDYFILVQTRWFYDHQRSFISARALWIQSTCRKEWLKHRSKIPSNGRCLWSTATGRGKARLVMTAWWRHHLKLFSRCWNGSRSQKWSLHVSIWAMLWGKVLNIPQSATRNIRPIQNLKLKKDSSRNASRFISRVRRSRHVNSIWSYCRASCWNEMFCSFSYHQLVSTKL